MRNLLKRILLGLLCGVLAMAQAESYTPEPGYERPVVGTTFSQAVENIPVTTDYVFGSAAVAGTGQIAIHNSTDLGTYFNPYEVNTGTITTNSEWERYQPFSSSANFVFNSNNLQLTGTLTAGTTSTVTASTVIGNFTGSTSSFLASNVGLANTNGITVGQLMFQIFRGNYYVTSVNSTTITALPLYGASTTLGPNLPLIFPPAYYALTNAASGAGTSVLNFAAVPSGVVPGQTVAFQINNTSTSSTKEYVVAPGGVTGTTVTITPALAAGDAVSSGQGIYFYPGIHSGQIWTQATYSMPGQNGATYFAMELTAQLPQNGNGYFNLSTANVNGAFGSWPAFWMRGDTLGSVDSSSELDVFELYDNAFRTMKIYDSNLISAGVQGGGPGIPQLADWLLTPPLWTVIAGAGGPIYSYDSTTDYSLAVHKFQILLTPDKVFRFIDGQMIKSVPWHWTSPTSPQLAANLAIGSLQGGLGSNGQFPINDANFPETYNIYELKIWQK